ncbi:hypothetical protein F5884DRAFT_757908 [Xylogone sp. PMI_703]|nr:hypothetical protein F5884DRAFT_757908 [Xylogone sp. PMI_703]
MWSYVPPEDGERREKELISNKDFWGEMVNQGSKVMRQDQDEVSAIGIIQYIIGQRRRVVLDIQEEMASGKTLDETSAGRELEAEIERMRKRHEADMRDLREEMMDAQRTNDKKAQEEIAAIRAELQKKLDQDREDIERMRVTVEELQKERDEELREAREKNYERELKHREAMAESTLKLKLMEIETSHQIERTKLIHEKEMAEWRANEAESRRGGCFIM